MYGVCIDDQIHLDRVLGFVESTPFGFRRCFSGFVFGLRVHRCLRLAGRASLGFSLSGEILRIGDARYPVRDLDGTMPHTAAVATFDMGEGVLHIPDGLPNAREVSVARWTCAMDHGSLSVADGALDAAGYVRVSAWLYTAGCGSMMACEVIDGRSPEALLGTS